MKTYGSQYAEEFIHNWKRFLDDCFIPCAKSKSDLLELNKGYPFKNIFDFTTAGDWDCVAAVERLPALHYSVDFIFLSFGIMGFIVDL